MAFALTEPDAGSNSHNVSTAARRTGAGWSITGGKYYISAVDECEALLLVARDDSAGSRRPEPRCRCSSCRPTRPACHAAADPDRAGLSRPPVHRVPRRRPRRRGRADRRGRARGSGRSSPASTRSGSWPRRCATASAGTPSPRPPTTPASGKVWSEPIGAHQGIAHPLAQAHVDVELARLATARAAELFDGGQDAAEAANIAKLAAADAALAALDQAIQTHGGNGLAIEYGLADLWFVTRLMRTAPVSREMVLNFVASHSLGLPLSY